jgi:eukaryotic-like serine/threonine-protein kinase
VSDDAMTRPLGKPGTGQPGTGETAPATPTEDGELAFGSRLGRYLVLGVLGRGGMGVVYEAYDQLLDRRIAIKLLRELEGDDATAGRVRMHREAQALARLSHPNVIAVHDVAEHDRTMYIAMELVEGKTLRDWQETRPWRDVIDAYTAAARGLAAAHDAGLVHRDFKPDNVLVGDDGRVRVTDFGLARLVADALVTEPHTPSQRNSTLTQAGAVMGTLAYMAPEQIDGATVDERSDQCSWCIAAWEGVYRQQPFITGNLALRGAAMKTDVPKPLASSAVPRALARVLQRGLLPDPAQRWPSMHALIAELERALSSKRLVFGVGAGAAAVIAAAVVALGHFASPPANDCARAGDPADTAWTPSIRDDIARAFAATGAPFASDALAGFERVLAPWRMRWQRMAIETCEAARAGATRVLDVRSACLLRERDTLATTIAAFGHADRKLVESAPTLALPDLDECSDAAALVGLPRPPADTVTRAVIEAALEVVERELAGGVSVERAKLLAPRVQSQIDAAIKLAWLPLVVRARRDLERVQVELGEGKPARATLLAAASSASASGDGDALVEIYLALAEVEANLTSSFELGDAWVELAAGTLAHLGLRPRKQVEVAQQRGLVARRAGRPKDARAAYAAALELARPLGELDELPTLRGLGHAETDLGELDAAHDHLDRALAIARRLLGDKHPQVGSLQHDLGTVDYRAGRYADAERRFHAAYDVLRAAWGDDSVEAAGALQAIGNVEVVLDRPADAERDFARAIAILEARLGADHPDVATAYNDIGATYHRAARYEQALANAQKVLALREKALGADHPDVAQSLVNAAIEAKNLQRWEVVDNNYPRALAIFEKAYGAHSFEVAVTLLNLGEARRAQGAYDAAQTAYERSLQILREQLGDDHPVLAHDYNGLGQLELARGHLDAARPLLERALAMRERDHGDATDLAESRFGVARVLAIPDPTRASELATAARDAYRAAGPGYVKRLAEVEAWLAARAPHVRGPEQ